MTRRPCRRDHGRDVGLADPVRARRRLTGLANLGSDLQVRFPAATLARVNHHNRLKQRLRAVEESLIVRARPDHPEVAAAIDDAVARIAAVGARFISAVHDAMAAKP